MTANQRGANVSALVRLLWLDPDDSSVASGTPALIEQGWIVDQACTLVEAVDRISKVAYDLVILDLQLPDALGTDAWLSLKSLQPTITGIMTTRSASLSRLIRVDAQGMIAFMQKPLPMQEIIALMTSARNRTEEKSEIV